MMMESVDELLARVSQLCDRNRDAILEALRLMLAAHASSMAQQQGKESTGAIVEIRAKDFISVNEAALLLGCSAQHLRNLVQRALDGKTVTPIPLCDLDGVITFPLDELMEWSRKPKASSKSRRNSTLKAAAS